MAAFKMTCLDWMLLFLLLDAGKGSFVCNDRASSMCNEDTCDSSNELYCMKTCNVCTDETCNKGYIMNNDTCKPCKDVTVEEKSGEEYTNKCPQCEIPTKLGKSCADNCPSNCRNQTCDRWSGHCHTCTDGLYGNFCEKKCETSCKNSSCARFNGACNGCESSLYGTWCKSKCGHCLNQTCGQHSGHCDGGCVDGYFGLKCDKNCSGYCLNKTCHIINESCAYGCIDGYHGPHCKENCSPGCLNRSCNRENGTCDRGCSSLQIIGDYCNISCSKNCKLGACRQDDSNNLVCSHGCIKTKTGQYCEDDCPLNCNSYDCVGCKPGFHGEKCTKTCSASCLNATCDQKSGSCTERCTSEEPDCCNHRCRGSGCWVAPDVTCVEGCRDGWKGDYCDASCPPGCSVCDQHDGGCSQCKDGLDQLAGTCVTLHVKENGSEESVISVTAVAAATLVTLSVVVTVVVFILRKKKCRYKHAMDDERLSYSQFNVAYNENVQSVEHRTDTSDPPDILRCHRSPPVSNDNDDDTDTQLFQSGGLASMFFNNSWIITDNELHQHNNIHRNQRNSLSIPTARTSERQRLNTPSARTSEQHALNIPSPRTLEQHGLNIPSPRTSEQHGLNIPSPRTSEQHGLNIPSPRTSEQHGLNIPSPRTSEQHALNISSRTPETQRECNLQTHEADDGDIDDLRGEQICLNSLERKQISHDICVNDRTADGMSPADDYVNLAQGLYVDVDVQDIEDTTPNPKPCYHHVRTSSVDADVLPLLQSDDHDVDVHEADNSVSILHFSTYVHNMREFRGFNAEFQILPGANLFSTEAADTPVNKKKNRYSNIKPYDYNRVKLAHIPGISNSDYINASFIDGYDESQRYVATQGPTEGTVCDFWRMVWGVNAKHVIMLTSLQDGEQVKCFMYWPDPEIWKKTYDDIIVTLRKVRVRPTFTSRTFCLAKKGENVPTRIVTQLHYTDWVDKGIPDDGRSLLAFLQYVKTLRTTENRRPLVVHCSAGVGRTGTFIALDCLLEQGLTEKKLDVFGCVSRLRKQRVRMVQTEEQYHFIHLLLLEWLSSQDYVTQDCITLAEGRK